VSERPPIGTRYTLAMADTSTHGVTVVPTGEMFPDDQVNVMHDGSGTVLTVPVDSLSTLPDIVRTVAATLRIAMEWYSGEQRDMLLEAADAVERNWDDGGTCPLCEEETCDEGCPLEPLRKAIESEYLRTRGSGEAEAPAPRAPAPYDVYPAHNDPGQWLWRCEGIRHCEGLMGIGYASEESAQDAYDAHATRDHGADPTTGQLHARCLHPGWEYATTEGQRKQWADADTPPADDHGDPDPTWERNTDRGRNGWERLDCTEESYWRRKVTA
jgi:hypothetical protein